MTLVCKSTIWCPYTFFIALRVGHAPSRSSVARHRGGFAVGLSHPKQTLGGSGIGVGWTMVSRTTTSPSPSASPATVGCALRSQQGPLTRSRQDPHGGSHEGDRWGREVPVVQCRDNERYAHASASACHPAEKPQQDAFIDQQAGNRRAIRQVPAAPRSPRSGPRRR